MNRLVLFTYTHCKQPVESFYKIQIIGGIFTESLCQLRDHLKQLKLDDKITDEVISLFSVKNYRKGQTFAVEGEKCDQIGFVVTGLFYMYAIEDNGTCFVKDFISDHQFMLAVLDTRKESTVSITPLINSVVLEAKYSEIQNLFQKYPELEKISRKKTETEFEAICGRMGLYASSPAEDRYCLFRDKFGSLEDIIPQYLVASYLGITPTHLCRIKTKLKRSHLYS